MQNPCLKRPFSLFIDTSEPADPEIYFPSPLKKVKKALTIEILDSFAESPSNSHAKSYELPQNCPFTSKKLLAYPLLTPKYSKNPQMLFSPRNRPGYSFSFGIDTEKDINTPLNQNYDDFYHEESFYDVTMRKCHRKTMEDRTVLEPELCGNHFNDKFFGIYDGHTSTYVSDFLKQNFHKKITSHPCYDDEPKTAFKEAFQQIDKEILHKLESADIQGGSTALCALVRGNKLYLANAGDSKAVLIKKNEMKEINREHRATDAEERLRIENLGGVVIVHKSRSLVQGSLQITRSIGDRKYKKYISCEPDVYEHDITNEDQMLIMASDGFWDVMNNSEVMEIIEKNGQQTPGLSKLLVEAAMKKRNYGLDNISLIVIYLPKL